MGKVAISLSVNLEELMMIEKMADEISISRSSMARILLRKGLAVSKKSKEATEKNDA